MQSVLSQGAAHTHHKRCSSFTITKGAAHSPSQKVQLIYHTRYTNGLLRAALQARVMKACIRYVCASGAGRWEPAAANMPTHDGQAAQLFYRGPPLYLYSTRKKRHTSRPTNSTAGFLDVGEGGGKRHATARRHFRCAHPSTACCGENRP